MYEIGTDGSCVPNPGAGGWGVSIFKDGVEVGGLKGGLPETTNNRMELTAFIRALQIIEENDIEPEVVWLDSQYVLNGCQSHLRSWIINNWKTSAKKPVKNQDLWEVVAQHRHVWRDLNMQWTKGHETHEVNIAADRLATEGREDAILGDW